MLSPERLELSYLLMSSPRPRAADAATVAITQGIHCNEVQSGLMLHDAELADALTSVNDCVPHSDGREVPLVIVSAVTLIKHPHVVGLDDTEILVCRAAGNHMRLVAGGELHSDAQRNQLELALLQFNIFSGPQVNPVGLAADVLDRKSVV